MQFGDAGCFTPTLWRPDLAETGLAGANVNMGGLVSAGLKNLRGVDTCTRIGYDQMLAALG